jgi:hypothetical protein
VAAVERQRVRAVEVVAAAGQEPHQGPAALPAGCHFVSGPGDALEAADLGGCDFPSGGDGDDAVVGPAVKVGGYAGPPQPCRAVWSGGEVTSIMAQGSTGAVTAGDWVHPRYHGLLSRLSKRMDARASVRLS